MCAAIANRFPPVPPRGQSVCGHLHPVQEAHRGGGERPRRGPELVKRKHVTLVGWPHPWQGFNTGPFLLSSDLEWSVFRALSTLYTHMHNL